MAFRESLRLGLLRTLVENFKAVKKNLPVEDPFEFEYSTVKLGPLGNPDNTKRAAIGVVTENETTDFSVNSLTIRNLRVAIEFRITVNKGDDDPAIMGERVLTEVQRIIIGDDTLGGKAVIVQEVANQIDLDTYADRAVQGVLFVNVKYRHFNDDNRTIAGTT